jgi:thiol-disulfide isomerase/thioredoxin
MIHQTSTPWRTTTRFLAMLLVATGIATTLPSSSATAQSITGTFPEMAGQDIRLQGFQGLDTYIISQTSINADGTFTLPYPIEARGMAYIISHDDESFLVVLSGEEIILKGESFTFQESIQVLQSEENLLFDRYAAEHPRREQTLSAWVYLNTIYQADSLFSVQQNPRQAIEQEIARIRAEDNNFLASLHPDTYISWYLPVRKLVSSVPVVAQFRTGDIPATIAAFRHLDYTDTRLHRSGLLRDVLESHVWLIENSGRSLDSVFVELNHSTDLITAQLSHEPQLLNALMQYLFDLLERRSLFPSAEHLARSLLSRHEEHLAVGLASRLERYRAVRIGSTAPDFAFSTNTIRPQGAPTQASRLSEVESDYILLVFAAGWCPHCREMMPDLTTKAVAWRQQGVEVVMVSLDDNPDSYQRFTRDVPFLVTTDFQRWGSPLARAYHVQGIPAMFLLDQNLEIVLRPNSVNHMDSWVDWYLVQGNPR